MSFTITKMAGKKVSFDMNSEVRVCTRYLEPHQEEEPEPVDPEDPKPTSLGLASGFKPGTVYFRSKVSAPGKKSLACQEVILNAASTKGSLDRLEMLLEEWLPKVEKQGWVAASKVCFPPRERSRFLYIKVRDYLHASGVDPQHLQPLITLIVEKL